MTASRQYANANRVFKDVFDARIHFLIAFVCCLIIQSSSEAEIVVNAGDGGDIQAAVDAAMTRAIVVPPGKNHGGTFSWQEEEVVLRGKFLLSRPIEIGKQTRLRGDGAILDGSRLPAGAFAITGSGHRCHITGSLTITNCPNGIRLNTGSMKSNLGGGQTLIQHVHFAGVPGTALDIQCRSSIVVVERCIFDKVGKIAHNRMCDQLTIRDSTSCPTGTSIPITTGHGKLVIDGGIYTPLNYAQKSSELAWIELLGGPYTRERMVLCHGARFGGEFGGLPVVINRARGRTEFPSGPGVCITLRDCLANNVAGRADVKALRPGALILLEELPNRIEISGCYGMVSPGPLVAFLPKIDPDAVTDPFSSDGINNRCELVLQSHNTIKAKTSLHPRLVPFIRNRP